MNIDVPETPDSITVKVKIKGEENVYLLSGMTHKKAKTVRELISKSNGSEEPTIVLTHSMTPQGKSIPVVSLLEVLSDEQAINLYRKATILTGWVKEDKNDPEIVVEKFKKIMQDEEIEDDARFVRLKVLYRELIGQDEAGNPKA